MLKINLRKVGWNFYVRGVMFYGKLVSDFFFILIILFFVLGFGEFFLSLLLNLVDNMECNEVVFFFEYVVFFIWSRVVNEMLYLE